MLKEELFKYFKKALTSWQKAKVTSCILPQINSHLAETLNGYIFRHKRFLIHEELTDILVNIAFLFTLLEHMNGASYEVSIFCSTHFNHLLILANFPCEIKKINNKDNRKLKNFYPLILYNDTLNYIWNSNIEEDFS